MLFYRNTTIEGGRYCRAKFVRFLRYVQHYSERRRRFIVIVRGLPEQILYSVENRDKRLEQKRLINKTRLNFDNNSITVLFSAGSDIKKSKTKL